MTVKRTYPGKEVNVILLGDMVLQYAREDQDELSAIDPDINEASLNRLDADLDTASTQYLGFKSTDDLKQATRVFTGIQGDALTKLGIVKRRIQSKFRRNEADRTFLLDMLGFTELFDEARYNGSQSTLVDLLYTYQAKLPEARTLLSSKNIPLTIINAPSLLADNLRSANVTQDTFKISGQEFTGEKRVFFNSIWDRILEITDAGKEQFADTAKENRYVPTRLREALGIYSRKKKKEDDGSGESGDNS